MVAGLLTLSSLGVYNFALLIASSLRITPYSNDSLINRSFFFIFLATSSEVDEKWRSLKNAKEYGNS